jgi:predicted peptidase
LQQAYTSSHLQYLLYLPENYGSVVGEKWPLILFLHGSGERGDDPQKIKKYCLPRELESRPDFPFIVLSPLCPADTRWIDLSASVMHLLNEILARYNIDERCVYLAGFSMGGEGVWYIAVEYPARFAAISPVAGKIPDTENFLSRLCVLKHMPIWVFHGTSDEFVPFENSQTLVDALQACDGDVRFTVYEGFTHGQSSDTTYRDERLYNWFLTHLR